MNEIIQYLIWSIESIVFVMAAGYLIGLFDRMIEKALMIITGGTFGCLFINYLTFPGVILHELSHALLAFLTGAEITHIHFFSPNGDSLGSVSIRPRGNFLTMSMQRGFSAMAPAFCSLLWLYFLKEFLYPYALNRPLIMLLFVYLCVAVVLHASLSDADIRVGLKGFPGCLIITFLVLYVGKIYPGNLYMKYFGIDPFAIITEVIGRI